MSVVVLGLMVLVPVLRTFSSFAGWDLPSGKVTIGGSGNAPISWTTRADIARFLGHALTVLPTSLLANKVFRIEGDRTVCLHIRPMPPIGTYR